MTETQIQSHLQPHIETIRDCIYGGHERYQQILNDGPDLRSAYGVREAATCTHALICQYAREHFQGVSGVQMSESPKFLVLVFDAGFNLRFKKLDDYRLASYNRTDQATRVARQDPDPFLPFPDFEFKEVLPNDGPMLVAGYQLDPTGTQIDDTLITCPAGRNRNAWWFSMNQQLGIRENTGLLLPLTTPVVLVPPITAKKDARKTKQA